VQLSRTFRPRKASNREIKNRRPHSFGLQAQAIRDRKTYVYGTPSLPTGAGSVFIDMEGDPERDLVYLIGMLVVENGEEKSISFWADSKDHEREIFDQFMETIDKYPNHKVYHYGNYEVSFLKRMRGQAHRKTPVDRVVARSVNVLASFYGTIYFP